MAYTRVSVTIEGKSISTQTDFDGKFSIKASKGDLLKFHYVGYKETSVMVNSKKPIIVKLETTDEMLAGEVIVRRTFFGRIFHSIGNLFR
ncbi:carboxypeptidase-like regulatory domain-containing protein [Flavobacterium lindanitolerans]|nr:carboxypeptidase-like regulatory domain-containing protein [Flavobacterium lindanitolerans]